MSDERIDPWKHLPAGNVNAGDNNSAGNEIPKMTLTTIQDSVGPSSLIRRVVYDSQETKPGTVQHDE